MDNPMFENATNTVLYAATTMQYFEKHKIMEILAVSYFYCNSVIHLFPLQKLFLELELNRPVDAIDYIACHLKDIANEIHYTKARVNLPDDVSKDQFIKSIKKDYNIPTIVFKPKKQYSTSEILKKSKKFLKKHSLNSKHAIYLNFPKKCEDSRKFLENDIIPSTIVEFNLEGDCCMDPLLRDYYGRLHHRIFLQTKKCPPNNEVKQSVNEAIIHMMNILRTTKITKVPYLRGCYYPRILILGRTGSGRRTQANNLINRFNLTKSNFCFLYKLINKLFSLSFSFSKLQ